VIRASKTSLDHYRSCLDERSRAAPAAAFFRHLKWYTSGSHKNYRSHYKHVPQNFKGFTKQFLFGRQGVTGSLHGEPDGWAQGACIPCSNPGLTEWLPAA
jgi:hypothetical protein